MSLLKDIWPSGLCTLRFTVHLNAEELDWEGLAGAAKSFDRFRVGKDYLAATIRGDQDDGEFHGHLDIDRRKSGGYTLEWRIATTRVSGTAENAPALTVLPSFLEPFIKTQDPDIRGVLTAFFRYSLDDTSPLLELPITNPDAPDGPVIAGIDVEFPESSGDLRRAYVGRFTDRNQLDVSLMISMQLRPLPDLLDRLTHAPARYVRLLIKSRDAAQSSIGGAG